MKTKLSNKIRLYACSMGKVFRVTHVCRTMEEANAEMMKDRDVALIAVDNTGLCYLAKQHGSVTPSAILEDYLRD